MSVEFQLNGSPVVVRGDHPHLLAALRDELDVTSPKDGCSPSGQCGCCTVLVDGKAIVSCQQSLLKTEGKAVTTLEGLSADGNHPVQVAWRDIDVPQCGYCQAGQMMSAAALLAKTPKPTDKDIDTAMNGNLCR